jgi:S1-C subfamily serine protease
MRFKVGIFLFLLACTAFASERRTAITVDGVSYVDIQDVHVVSGGRVVIMFPAGGSTIPADKLPHDFLAAWGVTDAQIAASKASAQKQNESALAQSIQAGYFREIDGVVYDLRKSPPGWRRFNDAKILGMTDGGALVDPSPNQISTTAIFVHHMPRIYADNEKVSFVAMASGDFSYVNRFGFEHTVRSYDIGHICTRNEIPDLIISKGVASANSPLAQHRGPQDRPHRITHAEHGLRGIGTGFFVTKDGYLLTNFHVVKGAARVEVQYKSHAPVKADIVETDEHADLALLKVDGTGFSPLAIARTANVDLGDEVFTIGFPNIEMQGFEPKYTDGKISSLDGIQDDTTEYQISVPVQPGNSGGPLCNEKGEVVGIVVARLNDMAALRETGAVPQNVNYAVKAKHALRLLQSVNGLEALLAPPPASRPEKPIHAVEEAIAMVQIY